MDLRNAVVIITGASSGIGAATAREIARQGARVVLAARRAQELQTLADEITAQGGQALAVAADVTDSESIERLVRTTIDTYGRIDVLINNAGINKGYPLADVPERELEQIIDVNLTGPARVTRAVIPHMQQQRSGIIMNVGSIAGEVATNSLYSATKFGIRGLTDALRRELRADNIKLVLIAPGFIRTPLTTGVKLPMPGPEAVALAIARAIRFPHRRVVVPWPYLPIMYIAKLLPWLADAIVGSSGFQKSYRNRKKSQHTR